MSADFPPAAAPSGTNSGPGAPHGASTGASPHAPHGAPPPAPPVGRTLPAGRGAAWWSDAWRLFTASPWMLLAIAVLFGVLLGAISAVPFVGSIASTLLTPVLAGGICVGCRALDRGGKLEIAHLFAGFGERLWPLVVVGILWFAGTAVIVLAFGAVLFATAGAAGISALLTGDPLQAGVATLAGLGIGAVAASVVALLLAVPLLMALWFAPALVALRNDEPLAAMKTSFGACLANFPPFVVYGLIGIALAIVASIPFGLGWLLLAPVGLASVYTSYRDIFGG